MVKLLLRLLPLVWLSLLASGCGFGTAAADGESSIEIGSADDRSDDRLSAEDAVDGQDGEILEVPGDTIPTRPEVIIPSSWDSEIEEVYGRYWLYWDAFAAAHAPPNADPSFGPLQNLSTEVNWQSLNQGLRDFADDGLVLVLPQNSITEHLVRVPNATVLTKDEGAEVILQDCWLDDFVQQTVDGQVLVETEEAKLMNVTMKVVNGEWRVHGVARATAESDGFEQCQSLISK